MRVVKEDNYWVVQSWFFGWKNVNNTRYSTEWAARSAMFRR